MKKMSKAKLRARRKWGIRIRERRVAAGWAVTGVGSIGWRLKQLGYKTYAAYLSSDHWKRVRGLFISPGTKCQACLLAEAVNLHHKNYKNLGSETQDDVVPLCGGCHRRVHISETMGCKTGLEGALKRVIKRNRKRS